LLRQIKGIKKSSACPKDFLKNNFLLSAYPCFFTAYRFLKTAYRYSFAFFRNFKHIMNRRADER